MPKRRHHGDVLSGGNQVHLLARLPRLMYDVSFFGNWQENACHCIEINSEEGTKRILATRCTRTHKIHSKAP